MKPLIHIGYNKTGTTWLQRNFYPYIKNVSFLDRAMVNRLIIRNNYFSFNANEVRNHISKIADKRILISEEELCLSPRAQPYVKIGLINRLHQIFPDSHIVILIRNQIDCLLSSYLYYIKWNGGTFSFYNFLFKENKFRAHTFNIKIENLQYHFFINYLSETFGQENIHIYPYEEFAHNNIFFLEKFCKIHGLEVDLNKINLQRANQAIKKNLIPIARLVNLFTKPHIVDRSHILTIPYLDKACRIIYPKINRQSIWGRNALPEDLLSEECIDYLNDYYRRSNRILIEKYSLPLEKYGYPT